MSIPLIHVDDLGSVQIQNVVKEEVLEQIVERMPLQTGKVAK